MERVVYMRPIVPGVHLHPVHQPCAYCHHHQVMFQQQVNMMMLQQQQQIQKDEDMIIHKEITKFMLQQQKKMMPKKFIWTLPGFGMLKLNTDGSSKGNPGPSSFGGLIRDCEGRWLCGFMGKMKGRAFTSLEADVWGIFQGLCLIKKKNLRNLFIETDCQAAIMMLLGVKGGGGRKDDHPMKKIMDAIETIMMEQKCVMVHTRRDDNHSADQLAKLGGQQSTDCMVLEEPPMCLIPYLIRDNEAATEFELNSHNY